MIAGRWRAALAAACMAATVAVPSPVRAGGPSSLKAGKCCPLIVKKSGSYVLNGNLQPNGANVDAIEVDASNVTIDLNGFSIIGPSKAGSGIGVDAAAQTNVTLKNGSVSQMGGSGIAVGSYGVVRNVTATGNGVGGSGSGIQCTGAACFVSNCVTGSNASQGLSFLDASSGYQDNVINGNLNGTVLLGTDMGGNVCNGVHGCP
jgi:hypothetical protein